MTLGRAIAKCISLRAPLFSLGPRGLGGTQGEQNGDGAAARSLCLWDSHSFDGVLFR